MFSNICEPVTSQEAERRMLREGETVFALSQEDEATSDLPSSAHKLTLNTVANTETSRNLAAEISPQSGITSLEGWNSALSSSTFHVKNTRKKYFC